MQSSKYSIRALAIQGCLAILLSGAAFAGDGANSRFTSDHDVPRFAARVDLHDVAQPLVTLSNEDGVEAVAIEVVAIDEDDHQNRRHSVRLEAGGRSILGFDSLGDFEILDLIGDGAFTATLEDALSGGEPQAIAITAAGDRVATKVATQCNGTWNLSCVSPSGCTYVSGYQPGRVESGNQVYWNLHTPTGAWTTIGSGCATSWYGIQSNGCPTYAYNCYGQTYLVTHNITEPDLIITNVSLSSTSVVSGNNVIVYYSVKNIGTATVTASYQERFLLKPSSGAAYEVYLGSSYGQDIAPGQSVSLAKTVEVSGSAGSYTLQVEADALDNVAESNESNNITGTPITLTAPAFPQLTINGLIYNPGSGNGWLFALENCPQASLCTRTFQLKSTGTSSAPVYITDSSDAYTTVTDNCPGSLSPGNTCTITIKHTLPLYTAKEWGGQLGVAYGTPSQAWYKICISDDATLCR